MKKSIFRHGSGNTEAQHNDVLSGYCLTTTVVIVQNEQFSVLAVGVLAFLLFS